MLTTNRYPIESVRKYRPFAGFVLELRAFQFAEILRRIQSNPILGNDPIARLAIARFGNGTRTDNQSIADFSNSFDMGMAMQHHVSAHPPPDGIMGQEEGFVEQRQGQGFGKGKPEP